MTLTREQRIIAGPRMEVSFYEIWPDGRRVSQRLPKEKRTPEAMAKYNRDKAQKKLLLLVNANFIKGDLLLTLTFDDEHLPEDWEEVHRMLENYILRLRRWRRKAGLSELKYLYTVEETERRSGRHAGKKHWHIHMFLSAMDRDAAEELWPAGVRVNARRYNPERFGPEAAAKYIGKALGVQGDGGRGKRFAYSRNLQQPERLEPRDGRITQRAVKQMVQKREHDGEYWERKYPGYRFAGFEKPAELCRNPYNGYYYLTVVLYKIGTNPPRRE